MKKIALAAAIAALAFAGCSKEEPKAPPAAPKATAPATPAPTAAVPPSTTAVPPSTTAAPATEEKKDEKK
jgi:hypothetical protein